MYDKMRNFFSGITFENYNIQHKMLFCQENSALLFFFFFLLDGVKWVETVGNLCFEMCEFHLSSLCPPCRSQTSNNILLN